MFVQTIKIVILHNITNVVQRLIWYYIEKTIKKDMLFVYF